MIAGNNPTADHTGVKSPVSWRAGVTSYQWRVLLVAWLGWVFDSMDAMIYALVLHPALHDLLPHSPSGHVSDADIAWYGGIIFSIFLIGWAIGGVVFGVLALGIGGEWAAGAALVAEVWPEEKRAKAAGVLQSAWAAGFFLAAAFYLLLRDHSWRVLFMVGVAPAVVALVVRWWVKEPERWVKAHALEVHSGTVHKVKLLELFQGALLRPTWVGASLAFVAVFGLWGATNWTPTLIRALPDMRGLSAPDLKTYVVYATMMLNVGSLLGYLSFGPLADRFGRRPTFALMCAGSLVMVPVTFLTPHAYGDVLVLLPLLGFFNNGIFSGFPIYLPELYPTRLRATGAGFCFNAGRVLASVGPFLTGFLVAELGTFGRAASAIALIYLLGILVLAWAPETRGRPLPE